jgi:hypothetical protein
MAPWSPLCCIETKTKTQHLLKKGKNIIEEEFEVENWSRFIVLTSNHPDLKKENL